MNILIIYGGKSCEHDISVITACLAKGYFDGNLYCAYFDKSNNCFLAPLDFTPQKHIGNNFKDKITFVFGEKRIAVYRGKRVRKFIDIDVAVNCCHGVNGEDGTIAALCKMTNIPLVGSDLISSAIAMDKILTKQVLTQLGFPVVEGKAVSKGDNNDSILDGLTFPIIVKPSTLGSSIGVEVCKSAEELLSALNKGFKYDDRILCEKALTDFIELNCSAMKRRGEIITGKVDSPYTLNDILTFNDKYISNDTCKKPRTELDAEIVNEVADMTRRIYKQIGFGGVIRVDYLFDNGSGTLYVNEINSIPGSLAYGLWEDKFSRTEFGQALVEEAVADYRASQQHIYFFDSGVLSAGGIKK